MSNLGYPLAGLKVLDFTRALAGPFASRMLSDLGADVVKVEPPDGDVTRIWGAVKGGVPGYYHQQNAGKRNVCLDLRADGAKKLVHDLVKQVDIVLENYRPGVMARLGLSYADLSSANPHIIMLSISGFGQDGPESHRPAYAPVVHAEAGLIKRHARRNGVAPKDLPLSVADTNASLHGLVAVLAALHQRTVTGEGQHIDLAMIDSTMCTDDQIHYDLEDSEATAPLPPDIWATGAGDVLVSVDFRYFWRLLNRECGVDDPAADDMDTAAKIMLRRDAASAFLLGLETWDEVEAVMHKLNLAWGKARDPVDIGEQETLAFRKAIVEIDDRAGGVRPIPQSPYRFSKATSGVRGVAPHRGEHNREILSEWLDMDEARISELTASGVLLEDDEVLG